VNESRVTAKLKSHHELNPRSHQFRPGHNKTNMKTSLRYLGLNALAAWDRLVQEHLNLLQKLTNIESAQVVLERQREDTPAFRAHMVLVVPGPDFHADAIDHTLTAALHKVVENLKRQIRARRTKRQVRGKSNLQLGAISRRRSGAFAGHRA